MNFPAAVANGGFQAATDDDGDFDLVIDEQQVVRDLAVDMAAHILDLADDAFDDLRIEFPQVKARAKQVFTGWRPSSDFFSYGLQ